MDLLVLCPTRGRPEAANAAYRSWLDHRADPDNQLVFVIDDDDPAIYSGIPVMLLRKEETGNMVKALNSAALKVLSGEDTPRYIGFIGDDHRFRSPNPDTRIVNALDDMGGGFVFGDDLAQRENLPTQIFMSSSVVRALGWMGLPTCRHLYIDNVWLTLGKGTNHLAYLPDVVIEHLHPAYGKAAWDEGHMRVNSELMYADDGAAFGRWLHDGAEADIATASAAL